MTFSINIDWHEEFKANYEKWENLGRQASEKLPGDDIL